MLAWVQVRMGSEGGQTLVEYTLLISLIAIVCIGGLTATGHSLSDFLTSIANDV